MADRPTLLSQASVRGAAPGLRGTLPDLGIYARSVGAAGRQLGQAGQQLAGSLAGLAETRARVAERQVILDERQAEKLDRAQKQQAEGLWSIMKNEMLHDKSTTQASDRAMRATRDDALQIDQEFRSRWVDEARRLREKHGTNPYMQTVLSDSEVSTHALQLMAPLVTSAITNESARNVAAAAESTIQDRVQKKTEYFNIMGGPRANLDWYKGIADSKELDPSAISPAINPGLWADVDNRIITRAQASAIVERWQDNLLGHALNQAQTANMTVEEAENVGTIMKNAGVWTGQQANQLLSSAISYRNRNTENFGGFDGRLSKYIARIQSGNTPRDLETENSFGEWFRHLHSSGKTKEALYNEAKFNAAIRRWDFFNKEGGRF